MNKTGGQESVQRHDPKLPQNAVEQDHLSNKEGEVHEMIADEGLGADEISQGMRQCGQEARRVFCGEHKEWAAFIIGKDMPFFPMPDAIKTKRQVQQQYKRGESADRREIGVLPASPAQPKTTGGKGQENQRAKQEAEARPNLKIWPRRSGRKK